ncbi:MAG: hypothetical protein ABL961_05175 [Vicinamibacterales bacterium]
MDLKRMLALGVSGGAVVVWVATAATSMSEPPPPPQPVPTVHAVDVSGAALAAEVSRLHERLRPTTVPLQARDLFAYAPRASVARAELVAPAVALPEAAVVVAAPVVPLALIGIAEDGPPDAIVRTAILSGLGDLFLVKEGETAAARFRVVAIQSGSVELIDTSDERSLSLTLP